MNGPKIDRAAIRDALRRKPRAVMSLDALLARCSRGGARGKRGARKQLLAELRRLERDGEVERVIGGYRLARRDGLVEASVLEVDVRGEAVVVDGRDRAWSVASFDDVEPGARVLIAPTEPEAARGSLVQSLERRGEGWVGIARVHGREPMLVAYRGRERFRIPIAARDLGGARDGEVVVVEPVAPRGRGKKRRGKRELQGRVVERLGRPGSPEADFRAIVFNHRLPVDFPARALDEAERAARSSERIEPRELEARLDLRERPFLTIDPASARDHDDAVYLEPAKQGQSLTLWVAIADVSHYVEGGSALDREALRRGNSVYFCDRAIPMLPEALSSDACSLRAGRDRLVVAVSLQITRDGRVERPRFHTAVIRVKANLSYEEVADAIEGRPPNGPAFDEEVREQLGSLSEVERRLGRRRFEQGSIDFDLPESEVILDAEGWPVAIERRARTRAHRAVEEAMLAANRAVAQWLLGQGRGSLYRVHDPPADERLAELRAEFAAFDLLDRGFDGPLDSHAIHCALLRARGRPMADRIHMLALRALTQAKYHEHNRGHFALGFEAYLHFTSPIRRYADLLVHRVVKHAIAPQHYPLDPRHASEDARAEVARYVSQRERVAIDAERDSLDLKKCVFMRERVGERYAGRITGVAAHGLFVTLDAHDVTGFVPAAALGSRLEFDARAQALKARGSGARYALGDALDVEVESVELERGWIRLALVRDAGRGAPAGDDAPAGSKKPARRDERNRDSGGRVRKERRGGRRVRRKSAPNRGRDRR